MTEQSDKRKMLARELYRASSGELTLERRRAQMMLTRYNAVTDGAPDLLLSLLREFMGSVGDGTVIITAIHVRLQLQHPPQRNVFINYHGIFLDCALIDIRNDITSKSALPLQLYTAQHPLGQMRLVRAGISATDPDRE